MCLNLNVSREGKSTLRYYGNRPRGRNLTRVGDLEKAKPVEAIFF